MKQELKKNFKTWNHENTLKFRYWSRVFRAKTLRVFLKGCLFYFTLEKRFHPVYKGQEKRILIIVVGGLGDCLLFDPLFRRLKEKWPNSRIDVLTGCFEHMWERLESVDNIMYFTPNNLKTPWEYALLFRTIYRNVYDIVAEGIAMFPTRGIYPVFSSLIFEASQAPIRIGRENTGRYAQLRPVYRGFIGSNEMSKKAGIKTGKKELQENPYLTHIIDLSPPDRRQYHESAQIFKSLGLSYHRKKDEPRLQPNPPLDRWAEKLLRHQWASKDDIIVGFTIETTRIIKSWPIENFISILEWGIRDNMKFVLLGLDQQPSTSLFKRFPREELLDLSGKTSLGEMISIIRQCNVFLSCDTGPSHIAQACRVPTVVLFGPSNEREFGPFDRELHTLIVPPMNLKCRPCVLGPCVQGKSCMQSIKCETVYDALLQKVRQFQTHQHKIATQHTKSPNVLCVI